MPENEVCKYCKVVLEFDDTVDEYADENAVILYNIGHCPKCGKNYKWNDIYVFNYREELKEI